MPLTYTDLIGNVRPAQAKDYLIYPWLLPGRLTLLAGPTDVGKTTLSLEFIAACVRGGNLWAKYPCQQIQSVLYLHAEHTLPTIQEAAAARGDIPSGIVHVVHDFQDIGPRVLINGRPNKLLLQELQALVSETRPQLIVVEPISAFLETSENDNREARAVIQTFCELAATSGAAVFVHHHFGKGIYDEERQEQKPKGIATGETRGGQAFEDAAERVLYLKRGKPGNKTVILETVKTKGYKVSPVHLLLDEETLTYHRQAIVPKAERDLLAIYEHTLRHPDMPIRARVEWFKEQWGMGSNYVHLHWKRAQRVGLIPLEPPDTPFPALENDSKDRNGHAPNVST